MRHKGFLASAQPAADTIRPLAGHEFDQFRQLAYRVFGLDLKPGKQDLVSSRLGKLVRQGGFRSYDEYYRSIVQDRTGEALAGMIDALTTNHTAFVREPEHFDFLRREVLPQLAGHDVIDVWSAACSTGEEVWTLAAILQETVGSRRWQVIGADISRRVLAFAEAGVYPLDRCAGLPAAWRGAFFEPVEGPTPALRVGKVLRSRATFQRLNLIEPLAWRRQFPVIFCRNVMIYFDSATQEKVVRQLAGCLEPGGYLFVGHAESLTRVPHGLEYVRPAVYRKPGERRGRWTR